MSKILLIAGGGTLGRYTAKELLALGNEVDTICLEDYISDNPNMRYFKGFATFEYLSEHLKDNRYDGIVNFIHYTDTEEYKRVHKLLTDNAKHLIFLSSYRVYADLQHPVTENAPQLFDVIEDDDFLENEDYAVPKSKNEHFIREESGTKNWTIVRPVISFSDRRLDIVTVSGHEVIERSAKKEKILLPIESKNLTAGLDWAGNSGKLIARLVLNKKAYGEAFTISSAQNFTWGEIAEFYSEITGAEFEWVDINKYSPQCIPWILKYDRLFDRKIDNTKVMEVTGLTKNDFVSVKDGIKIEVENITLSKKGN